MDCTEKHDQTVVEAEQKQIFLDTISRNREYANVPKIFQNSTFDDFKIDPVSLHMDGFTPRHCRAIVKVRDIVMRFADAIESGDSQRMTLQGGFGTGKSLLAAICVNQIVNKGGTAKFEMASLLCRRLMNNLEYESIILDLAKYDLVIIDDLTMANASLFTEKTMADIIDAIYSNNKSLIITTNALVPELVKLIGDRGYDRIQESPNGGIVKFKWPTFRGTKTQSR
jgi:DNA replication protein DnaC